MAADDRLTVIADWALGRTPGTGPLVLGITGAVAAGKSTFASDLASHLGQSRPRIELVCSDGFLYPNAVLTERNIELLYKSAPLHDIGKVGIPDRILLKPGKLTAEEIGRAHV